MIFEPYSVIAWWLNSCKGCENMFLQRGTFRDTCNVSTNKSALATIQHLPNTQTENPSPCAVNYVAEILQKMLQSIALKNEFLGTYCAI